VILPTFESLDSKLRSIDQLHAWRQILGMPLLNIGEKFCNPFRLDRRPGCRLYVHNGIVLLSDFGSMMFNGKSVIGVSKLTNSDFLDLPSNERITQVKKEFTLNYVPKEYTSEDKEYWEQYGISTSQLNFENIKSVGYFEFGTDTIRSVFPSDLTFCINVEDKHKIYRPYQKELRFLANFKGTEIGGNTKLRSEPIYTKSAKDYMVLCNFGYDSRFIHSESVKNVPVGTYLVDNDQAGKTYANYLRTIGCKAFTLPDEFPKDISDCYKLYGHNESRRIAQHTLQSF